MENGEIVRPGDRVEINKSLRLGQTGENKFINDNGLYTFGTVNGAQVEFLIDSGSTASLLSKETFDKINKLGSIQTQEGKMQIQGVDGSNIKTYGCADIVVEFDDTKVQHKIIVCDISPDGILGQDFLLRHIESLDFDTMTLRTRRNGTINCHCVKSEKMCCRVIATEDVEIPPRSFMYVPVSSEVNSFKGTGLLASSDSNTAGVDIKVIPGLVDMNMLEGVSVLNESDDILSIQKGTEVGTCSNAEEIPETCAHLIEKKESHQCDKVKGIPDHLKELYNRSTVHLEDEEKERFTELLLRYQDVFSKTPGDLGRADGVKHSIDTGDAKPIRQAPRRLPIGKRETEKLEIDKMLERGVIEPSSSAWLSPIVLVTKKDGSTRFCVDYRHLNDVTAKDAYPLPRIDDCLDALAGAKWFSSMDLNSGFWQIPLSENDKEKTSFVTTQGLFQFKVMPFGLVNAPSTFQRLMENVLRGIQWRESLLYMDDIITPGQTVDQALERLENVFKRLLQSNLKLKPSKCIFFQKSVDVLGHTVSEKGVQTDERKISAVRDWPVPVNTKQDGAEGRQRERGDKGSRRKPGEESGRKE